MRQLEYAEFPPAPALRGVVRCYWQLTGSAAAQRRAEPALPDGHPELIVNLARPFRAHVDRRVVTQPMVMLVGQITRPLHVEASGDVALFAVRFEPHGAAILHQPMSVLTDAWIDARSVCAEFGHLRTTLTRTAPVQEWIDAADRALIARVTQRDRIDNRVTSAVRVIVESNGMVTARRAAALAHTTPRHMQRLFLRDVGVSPKTLSQVRRFQRVFVALRDGTDGWSKIAVECGYFDQAHLIRDFARFAGGAPAGILARITEFTRQFTPLGAAPPTRPRR